MHTEKNSEWDLVLSPQRHWFDLHLKDLWRYRDLLMLFVRRDIVAFYKQTILGPVWYFIQPIFTTAMFMFVFGNLARISTDSLPQPLFYLAGITTWSYFADCLNKTATVFRDNAAIFGKVYFPRLIMPISLVISNLYKFGVQLLLYVAVILYYLVQGTTLQLDLYILLFPVLVILMGAQALGIGMIISALTTKYRDLALLLTFGIQLLMYATTVVYPLSSLGGKMYTLVSLNPMTPIIEGIRRSTLGVGSFDMSSFAYAFVSTTIILMLGVLIFNKVEKNFVDTI